jgi:hypothetical protein
MNEPLTSPVKLRDSTKTFLANHKLKGKKEFKSLDDVIRFFINKAGFKIK